MTELTSATLENWLAAYGWRFESLGEETWRTGFSGEHRYFPLDIKLTPTCVSFEVKPLVDGHVEPRVSPELAKCLLEFNSRMQVVKLGLTEDGEVTLSCQVLAAGFDYDTLTRILGILGYYADTVAPEILARTTMAPPGGRPSLLC